MDIHCLPGRLGDTIYASGKLTVDALGSGTTSHCRQSGRPGSSQGAVVPRPTSTAVNELQSHSAVPSQHRYKNVPDARIKQLASCSHQVDAIQHSQRF